MSLQVFRVLFMGMHCGLESRWVLFDKGKNFAGTFPFYFGEKGHKKGPRQMRLL